MSEGNCTHKWSTTNVRNGYLVVEGCFMCGGRISFFSEEPVPPIDGYREGDHFWTYMNSFQATMFDLKCDKCGEVVSLKDVMALALCMNCDKECEVARIARKGGRKRWAYLALCANTTHPDGVCVSPEGIKALTDYFNSGIKDPEKKIEVIPCILRRKVDTCQCVILADVGLTELY